MKNKKIIIILLIIFIVLVGSLFYKYKFNVFNKKTNEDIPVINLDKEYEEENIEIIYQDKINSLKEEYDNQDIVGILSVENSDFNEIIVQTTDNDYYLEHSITHQSDWRGHAFLDYRLNINESKKLLIYGHNSTKNYVPFKFFENYYDSDFFKEHKYIYLQTDSELKKYEIFSVYIEVSDWSYFTKIKFSTNESYYKHILELKNKSLYDTGVNINKDDEVLILQTCSYHKDYSNYEDRFLLIIGKRV